MDRQTLRDWVHRFNERGPEGLKDSWSKGHPPRLSAEQLAQLAEVVERPGARRPWSRALAPGGPAADRGRALRRRLPRAHDRQDPQAARLLARQRASAPSGQGRGDRGGFQKNFAATLNTHRAGLPKGKPIEIWFQDEARIGQKNGLVRQWARRGSRPRQPADQRYESAYLFGAICPARGTGAALALPYADSEAMQLHLDEVSSSVRRGAHAVLLLDRAGWHTSSRLIVPKNITLVFLPSRAPELNPVENIWQYLRANWLSNRMLDLAGAGHAPGSWRAPVVATTASSATGEGVAEVWDAVLAHRDHLLAGSGEGLAERRRRR